MPATALGEFLGTAVLLLLGDGVVANVLLTRAKGHGSGWLVITAGWAFAVFFGVLVASALGAPGELNPAATIANVVLGTRTPGDALWHVAAQVAGAFTGATLVWLQYLPHWRETGDPEAIRGVFCTAPAIRAPLPNLLSEVIATAVLVFGANAAVQAASAGGAPTAPVTAALVLALVWGIGLSLGGPTGYAINPARDLGPRLAHAVLPVANKGSSDWGYGWIPVVGPCAGAVVAALLWQSVR